MTIGKKIKALRKEYGLNQVELAKRVGLSKQTLYKYENGIITNIPSDKIELLAQALHTTPAYLMGWEENPKVQISGLDEEYYEDAEIRDMVDLLHKSPEYRILMSASKRLSKKDLKLIIEMVERMS